MTEQPEEEVCCKDCGGLITTQYISPRLLCVCPLFPIIEEEEESGEDE